jgi:predicted HNH restriction endonuclease
VEAVWFKSCSHGDCRTKTSGSLRAQFLQWAIPKIVRERLHIEDGDHHLVSVAHILYSETLMLRVTSGGEIRLPARISKILQQQANDNPSTSIAFAIHIVHDDRAAIAAFERDVVASRQLSPEARRARLKNSSGKPLVRTVVMTIFNRNPDVVAEVLYRASGRCERCGSQAPFSRRSDGQPYLEVHHKFQLAHGGDDIVENAEALCPNCHRRAHHG